MFYPKLKKIFYVYSLSLKTTSKFLASSGSHFSPFLRSLFLSYNNSSLHAGAKLILVLSTIASTGQAA